ncbi:MULTISPECIES: amidohydrolase [unclassified Mycolicibacterium]|uniref:amidohydrolase n=1 Tax=unclassified Mycolicibacterium TaxID=2636767 RepID=UPI002ED8873A
MRDIVGPRTQVVDLGAATLTPGLTDGHTHPVHGIGMTFGTDLTGVSSIPELMTALQTAPVQDGWLLAWGLDINAFAGAPVTNVPLTEVLGPNIPAYIAMSDAHSALANPAALQRADVTGPRTFDGHASIVCDESGMPTGHLVEFEAMALVQNVLPAESTQSRQHRLRTLLQSMAEVGITAGNVMDFGADSGALMAALESDGDLPIRLRFAPWCVPGDDTEQLDYIVELQRQGGRRWQVDGVKFFIDGTIEGGTAWLEAPDCYGESTTPNWPDIDEYRAATHYLAAHGVPVVTHAIGDAAVRFAVQTLASAARVRARHRIEHIETIPDDLVAAFARTGIVASMQPSYCTRFSKADHSDAWSTRVGPQRASRAFRTRDIRDSGAILALGSDWPVAPFDPRAILADSQLRRRSGHPEDTPICPKQSLTARMALEGYTSHAAIAQGDADRAGAIAPGFRADFTAFTVDPLAAPPDELAEAPIAATVVAGTFTHRTA